MTNFESHQCRSCSIRIVDHSADEAEECIRQLQHQHHIDELQIRMTKDDDEFEYYLTQLQQNYEGVRC